MSLLNANCRRCMELVPEIDESVRGTRWVLESALLEDCLEGHFPVSIYIYFFFLYIYC